MTLTPLILGRGNSGQAIARSLVCLRERHPALGLHAPVPVERGSPLRALRARHENPVLFVANPHGLHAQTILEADAAGFAAIVCEKPSCVTPEQAESLANVRSRVAVLHVYRHMWGPQTLKAMVGSGELGDVIAVEGRYWQSSAAARALASASPGGAADAKKSWKNDTALAGPFDTFLDIGTHWADLAAFLHGAPPERVEGWRSFANAEAPHRDTHVQLAFTFPGGGRALGSVSKTCHGATNQLEVTVMGTRASASWSFLNPDEVVVGQGRDRRVITRATTRFGSGLPPFHGMGWLEGYTEIIHQVLRETATGEAGDYPKLEGNLALMKALFATEWR